MPIWLPRVAHKMLRRNSTRTKKICSCGGDQSFDFSDRDRWGLISQFQVRTIGVTSGNRRFDRRGSCT
jgi:hypothetical protein